MLYSKNISLESNTLTTSSLKELRCTIREVKDLSIPDPYKYHPWPHLMLCSDFYTGSFTDHTAVIHDWLFNFPGCPERRHCIDVTIQVRKSHLFQSLILRQCHDSITILSLFPIWQMMRSYWIEIRMGFLFVSGDYIVRETQFISIYSFRLLCDL